MRRFRTPGAAAVLVCVVVAASSWPGVAAAEPTPADKTAAASDNQKATAAATKKLFRAAAELYESSYKHVPDPKTLLNAAGAWQKNGDYAKAANAYARFLKEAPEKAPQRDKAKKELDALGGKLGQLGIKAEGASLVSVDGEAIDLPPVPIVYVSPGAHELEARFGQKKVAQSASAPAGALTSVVLALPAEARPPPPAVVVAPAPAKPVAAPERAKPLPPLVVYIGAGATVIAGGLTVLSALDTTSQKTTFDAAPTQDNLDSGNAKQLRTNILLAVTGGLAVFTVAFAVFLVDWKGKSTEPSVKVGAGPGSLVMLGTF